MFVGFAWFCLENSHLLLDFVYCSWVNGSKCFSPQGPDILWRVRGRGFSRCLSIYVCLMFLLWLVCFILSGLCCAIVVIDVLVGIFVGVCGFMGICLIFWNRRVCLLIGLSCCVVPFMS